MKFKKKILPNLSFFLILSFLFNLVRSNTLNRYSKNKHRKLWDEEIRYDSSGMSSEEKEAMEKCENSDYKYFIHLATGNIVTFEKYVNRDNAVNIIL